MWDRRPVRFGATSGRERFLPGDRHLPGSLVYGVGSTDVRADALVGDRVWYRNPIVLGCGALALAILFCLSVW